MLTHARRCSERRAVFIIGMAVLALAYEAAAEPAAESSRSWEPAFSVGFNVQNQGFETSVDSDPLVYDSGPPITYDGLGVFGSNSSTVLSSTFRFDGALYTPSMFKGGGGTRLFAHAGAQVPLSEDFAVMRVSQSFNRGDLRIALPGNPYCPTNELVDGKTAKTCDHSATTDLNYEIGWYAGLGLEFTLPIGRRQFRFRPSVDYFRQSLHFDGSVSRVDRAFRNATQGTAEGEVIREVSASASASELVHALGPRLTFDVEAARLGAFSLNVFLESQLYWILSERDILFSGQSTDGATADFRVKLRPLIAQGGAGLRVVWRGD